MSAQSSLLAAARGFDIDQALVAAGDERTGEIRASSLIRYIQAELNLSFERTRDMLNLLVELGCATWVSFTALRVVSASAE